MIYLKNSAPDSGSWLLSPHMSQRQPFSVEGCRIMVNTGHLLVD